MDADRAARKWARRWVAEMLLDYEPELDDEQLRGDYATAGPADPPEVIAAKRAALRSLAVLLRDMAAVGGESQHHAAAVALGRRGGRKGGLARAATLSPERRREIGRLGAAARWGKETDHA